MTRFGIDIKKTQGTYPWVNSYRVSAESLIEAAGAVSAIANFEADIHLTSVTFVGARVWRTGTENPDDFMNILFTDFHGERSQSGTFPTPAWTAIYASLAVPTGRPGKKMYRYCTTHEEIIGGGDGATFNPAAGLLTAFPAAVTNLFDALATEGVNLIVGGVLDSDLAARTVTNIVLVKPGHLDQHHGWFNKAAE